MREQQRFSYTLARSHGQADIDLYFGETPAQAHAYMRMPQIRGFEVLAVGRPAEELPRLVSRISALCPWHHHLAATMAVEDALGLTVPPAAKNIRELVLLLGHISDKLLHFFVLSAPDIDPTVPKRECLLRLLGVSALPHAVMEARQNLARLLQALTGQAWGGECALIGGQSCGMKQDDLAPLLKEMAAIRDFCLEGMEIAHDTLLRPLFKMFRALDCVPFASMGCVDEKGALCLTSSPKAVLRIVQPDGSRVDFAPHDYQQHIVEEYADWTRASFLRLRDAPPLKLDPEHTQGVFRVGPLARLHACDSISTPLAQRELERFRSEHGSLPQHAMLYHWARLIELLHCMEKAETLLQNLDLADDRIRTMPAAQDSAAPSQGFAHLEAPRGSLFYRIELDENRCVSACEIVSPTACNNAAINISLTQALRYCLTQSPDPEAAFPPSPTAPPFLDDTQLHMISTCARAYAPCPACATHALVLPACPPNATRKVCHAR